MRNVLPGPAGASEGGGASSVWAGMCWDWLPPCWVCWLEESDESDESELDDDAAEDDDSSGMSGIGIGGKFNRSSGMSGGGIGGCPLIINGPLALLSSVDQPPLPSVAPMLQDTWRLPADQLGSEMVL